MQQSLDKKMQTSSKPEMPIVAIDFGLKRIGIAVCDSKGIVATPVDTLLLTDNKTLDDISTEIGEIANMYRAKTYLIGMPQAFVENHEKIGNIIRKFADSLQKISDKPIIFYDESFSTLASTNMLISLGYKKSKLKSVVDKSSAAYFLQEFLNNIK